MIDFFKRAVLFSVTIVWCSGANAVDEIKDSLQDQPVYVLKADLPLSHPSFQYLINDGSAVVSLPESMPPILTFFTPYPESFLDKNPDSFKLYHITPEFLEQEQKSLNAIACREAHEAKEWQRLYDLILEYFEINHILLLLKHTRETWDSNCQWLREQPESINKYDRVTPRWDAMEEIFALSVEKKTHLKTLFAGFTLSRIVLLDEAFRAILEGRFHEGVSSFFINELYPSAFSTHESVLKNKRRKNYLKK